MITSLPFKTHVKNLVSRLYLIIKETTLLSSRVRLWAMMGMFMSLSFSVIAQTVTTDKLDYTVGQKAYASGTGWPANAVITLNVHKEAVNLATSIL